MLNHQFDQEVLNKRLFVSPQTHWVLTKTLQSDQSQPSVISQCRGYKTPLFIKPGRHTQDHVWLVRELYMVRPRAAAVKTYLCGDVDVSELLGGLLAARLGSLLPPDDNLIGRYSLVTSSELVYAGRVYDRCGGLNGEVLKQCG